MRKEAGRRTVHARSAAQALTAGHDGRATAKRSALLTDLELDRRTVWTQVVEVVCGLDVEGVAAGGWARFDDQYAERRIGSGQTSGDNTATGATWGRMRHGQ